MSALRDGESRSDAGGAFVTPEYGLEDMSGTITLNTSGDVSYGPGPVLYIPHQGASIWRRLWFLVSCIPRYLITGLVEVP